METNLTNVSIKLEESEKQIQSLKLQIETLNEKLRNRENKIHDLESDLVAKNNEVLMNFLFERELLFNQPFIAILRENYLNLSLVMNKIINIC